MKVINSSWESYALKITGGSLGWKFLLVISVALGICTGANAQGFSCGSTQANERVARENPVVLNHQQVLEDFARRFKAEYGISSAARSGNIVIPIVFHIIHNYGRENITDDQVYDQMRVLNEDFNKLNPDTADVVFEFRDIIANVGIEFRLARLDPQGNPTTGIEHIPAMQTYDGRDNAKLNPWPREKYLNVWVVQSMEDGVAGYAYLPATVHGLIQDKDGIAILQQYMGSIGTGNAYRSRALTHEIGHYLNLMHTWGGNNQPEEACGDDGVDDTPITRGATSCKLTKRECDINILENVQNFMDYSYCSKMFTEGQKVRMLATLNSNISGRNNLWAQSNLLATGVADGITVPDPKPIAMGGNVRKYACVGDPVVFTDASFNYLGRLDYREWSFQNADVDISMDSVVTVRFNQPGWQKLRLLVSNTAGQSVYEEDSVVFVSGGGVEAYNQFYEGFEDPYSASLWTTVNYNKTKGSFTFNSTASRSGNNCYYVNNYKRVRQGDIEELISPMLDLSQLNPMTISYQYSLASADQYFYERSVDSVKWFFSTDCGKTWYLLYKSGGPDLVNAGYLLSNYVPPHGMGYYWRKVTFFVQNNIKKPNVLIKVQYKGGQLSNNFYIDDINIGEATTGIANVRDVSVVNALVVPNPVSGNASVNFTLEYQQKIKAEVLDMNGRVVKTLCNDNLPAGDNKLFIAGSSLPSAGVYNVRITTGTGIVNTRFVLAR